MCDFEFLRGYECLAAWIYMLILYVTFLLAWYSEDIKRFVRRMNKK